MFTFAILDDDIEILGQYITLLPQIFKQNNIKGEIGLSTSSPDEFMKFIRSNKANVCIIDIDLESKISGLSIAHQIRSEKINIEIIFISGMLAYITQVFDVQPYNFIPKPINSNLETCIKKLADEFDYRYNFRKKINITYGDIAQYIPIDEITFIEHMNIHTIIHTLDKTSFKTCEGLEELISRIGNSIIKKCHRSIFVNLNNINSIDFKKRTITFDNGCSCPLGPSFYADFKDIGVI